MKKNGTRIIGWIIAIALAAMFVKVGIDKVTGVPEMTNNFEKWGYGERFMMLIGVLEILGAIGLLIPRIWYLASAGLIGLMLGATYTHINAGEPFFPPLTMVVGLVVYMFVRKNAQ